MKKLNENTDKYMIYKNSITDDFIAIDKVHVSKMDVYYRDFNKFKDVPENVTIESYLFIPDEKKDTLKIDYSKKVDVRVKDIESVWLRVQE